MNTEMTWPHCKCSVAMFVLGPPIGQHRSKRQELEPTLVWKECERQDKLQQFNKEPRLVSMQHLICQTDWSMVLFALFLPASLSLRMLFHGQKKIGFLFNWRPGGLWAWTRHWRALLWLVCYSPACMFQAGASCSHSGCSWGEGWGLMSSQLWGDLYLATITNLKWRVFALNLCK